MLSGFTGIIVEEQKESKGVGVGHKDESELRLLDG